MMGGLGGGLGLLGGLLGTLFTIGVLVGLVALTVWLVRTLFPSINQPPALPSDRGLGAREILDRRFARGEINREEYDLMRETISDGIA